ncbi:anti-sigma factor family protein [Pseudonocardia sp. GCM10023141]|uniref:anti-sigma factor family protein n=1 Tax=Pseudonocardia sp. GCM10023141 TaxID=3252653 RepID=UPI00361242BB
MTVPDWGQDHLSSDAIVAYVDNELADGPQQRATRHLAECPECAAQVVAQGQARSALRAAACPSLPSSLLSSLRSIPQDTDLPGPPPGLAMTADGQLVSVLRPERSAAPMPHGIAGPHHVSGPMSGPLPLDEPPAGLAGESLVPSQERRPVQRRIRLGAGAAVSGLALGALAFTAPNVENAPPPTASIDRGVLGGSAFGTSAFGTSAFGTTADVTDASLRVAPAGQLEPLLDRMSRVPGSFLGQH